ncbi:MAG: hypothetical protein JXR95_03385 [Deltaproteobacteria bacterium]|nr:hypothetical protein [Deltaproteobacteria bacterium]
MSNFKNLEYILDHHFDSKSCRHYVNGFVNVLHCHHYATLYAQLADDAGMLDGKLLLAESCEDVFYDVLKKYYIENGICSIRDKINIAEQYYSATGLGKIHFQKAGPESGYTELTHSHVDEGWIKKWGTRDKPVNFMTQGFISAVFSLLFDTPRRSFEVFEEESIVSGATKSSFKIVRK